MLFSTSASVNWAHGRRQGSDPRQELSRRTVGTLKAHEPRRAGCGAQRVSEFPPEGLRGMAQTGSARIFEFIALTTPAKDH